jgi:hypothetical protein
MSCIIHKLILGILVIFYSLAALVPSCHAATNLALGKSYTFSPLAKYPYTAPPTDTTSLTNGKYTVDRFWIQKSTVGWWPVATVEILIDLEKVSIIDGITFNTAREISSGVIYPSQIHAFVGPDKEHLQYVGDIADQPGNQIGTYQVKKFQLTNIKAKGRYVLLEILASQNKGVFCDEIEVLQGDSDSGRTGNLTIDAARKMAAGLRWPARELKQLNTFLADNSAPSASINLQEIVEQSLTSSEEVNSQMLAARTNLLQSRFPGQSLLVEAVKPWASFSPFASVTGVVPQQLSLMTPVGGYDHLAVVITNPKKTSQNISLSLATLPQGIAELTLYRVPFVRSAATEYVADPLLPETTFTLRPGESRLVYISARGKSAGDWNSLLTVAGDEQAIPIPISCQVKRVSLPEIMTLNSVNWGYLRFSLISDRKTQAVNDLFAHHTRVVVVPETHLTGGNLKKIATINDFLVLESYLKQHQGASKLLLGLGLGTADRKTIVGKYPFLSKEWQDEFKKWYANAILAAGRAGFSESQIYLYPYDEIAGVQIDDFVRLATWTNGAIPTAKFYLTFGDETYNSKRWDVMLPLLNIIQAAHEQTLQGSSPFKGEAWIYNTGGMSRSLSPYSYYRLMAWNAFLKGYTGIGFWAYADIGDNDVTAWKELARDFTIIYEGKDSNIISSRRWEAWRMGIEDYELLTMYARLKGASVAKELAASVFNFPDDTTKADEARRKILMELSAVNILPSPTGLRRVVK